MFTIMLKIKIERTVTGEMVEATEGLVELIDALEWQLADLQIEYGTR